MKVSSAPPAPAVVEFPDKFDEEFANSRPPSDVLELAEVRRALRTRLLGRSSAPLRLQRYEIRRFLGAGGHGSVHEAFDPTLDRRVAIKILRSAWEGEDGRDTGHEVRLLSEARSIARTSDPRVVVVFDVAHCPAEFLAATGEKVVTSGVFMVMEYVDGRTLRQWLKESAPPLADILRVFLEAARGLLAAHRGGVVHGDFKPENVMITVDGRVKILDFGIARAVGASLGTPRFTGTFNYASPEQRRGEPLDEKSDQYSFCQVLDEAVHWAHAAAAEASKQKGGAPVRARDGDAPRIARAVDRVVRRGLALSPRDRFDSMEQLASTLERACGRRSLQSRLVPVALIGLTMLAPLAAGEGSPTATAFASCLEVTSSNIWSKARASRLEQAFCSTELPYARDSWKSVAGELESYAARFRQSAVVACSLGDQPLLARQGRGRDAQVTEPRTAVLGCLEDRRRTLGSLLDLMEERPKEVLPHAVDGVFSLRRPATCLSLGGEPDSPRTGVPACAAAIENQLYGLDAGLTAATFDEGMAQSAAVRAAALACDPTRLGPWAELVHGLYLLNAAQPVPASTTLRAAFLAAETAGDSRVAMRALTAQIVAYDKRKGENPFVDHLIEDGMARLNAAARDAGHDLEASFLEEVSRVRRHQGRYAEALELAQRSVRLREKHWGEHHPLTGIAKKRLADVYYKQRDFRSAEALGLGVMEDLLSYVGPHHPDIAALHTLLGNIAWRRGHYESAETHFADTQRIWSQLFGSDDPRALGAVRARAAAHVSAGQFAMAWSELEPLLARPRDPRDESNVRANLTVTAAEALTGMGRYELASQLLEFAMAEQTRDRGDKQEGWGHSLIGLGYLELARGNATKAQEHCDRAVALWRELFGDRDPRLSWAYACLGRAELTSGHRKTAARALELALSLFDSDVDDPNHLAEIEFVLARSLEQDDPARALALATKSADLYLKLPAHRDQAGPVFGWQRRLSSANSRGVRP